ncbi:hypothetical protein ATJ97_2545 [Georgenia soli]|uniref:Uncharacterized protein n=1 Tax=Georgenia soli TaxID=638953 RepID=A0A2A9EP53_9MICO|nr:hypothetical protein [Georgenia soli]PFG40025.1 hypothetical protein ATJ97_2545 [Georgenia soli]
MTADRRVNDYLDDVARMLASIDPVDRAEILAGLREHIDASLTEVERPVDDATVRQVLTELGPPDRVAASALSTLGPVPRPIDRPTAPVALSRPPLTQPWVPVTVGLLTALTVGLYLLVLGVSVALLVTEQPATPPGAGSVDTPTPLLPASYDILWNMLAPLPLVGVPWLVSTILLASSALWSTWQKWAGALLAPVLAACCGLVAWFGSLVQPGVTRSVVLVAVGSAVAVAAVGVLVRLWREGARRAREPVPAGVPA